MKRIGLVLITVAVVSGLLINVGNVVLCYDDDGDVHIKTIAGSFSLPSPASSGNGVAKVPVPSLRDDRCGSCIDVPFGKRKLFVSSASKKKSSRTNTAWCRLGTNPKIIAEILPGNALSLAPGSSDNFLFSLRTVILLI